MERLDNIVVTPEFDQMCKGLRMSTDDLITTAQVAQRLDVSVATVNRWVRDGRIVPAQKLPGATGANLFRPADVDTMQASA